MIILGITWLLCELADRWTQERRVGQAIAVLGLVLFALHCLGVHLPACLTTL